MVGDSSEQIAAQKEVLNIVLADGRLREFLPKNGEAFDVNREGKDGGHLLHDAIFQKDINLVKLLIKAGANVNQKDINGETALHYAMMNGREEIVKILVEAEADINLPSDVKVSVTGPRREVSPKDVAQGMSPAMLEIINSGKNDDNTKESVSWFGSLIKFIQSRLGQKKQVNEVITEVPIEKTPLKLAWSSRAAKIYEFLSIPERKVEGIYNSRTSKGRKRSNSHSF